MKSVTALICLSLIICAPISYANTLPEKHTSYKKLGRGMGNFTSAPGEYVESFAEEQDRTGNVLSATFVAMTHGTHRVVKRGLAGIKDVLTFPFKSRRGYEPSMKTFNIDQMQDNILGTTSSIDDLAGA